MTRYVVTGAGGLLGSAFVEALRGRPVTTLGRAALSRPEAAAEAVLAAEADVVIHCAAHTNVEGAELRPETDWTANAALPDAVASACRAGGALMVHISSTGCYGSWKAEPYTEADPFLPTTAHHRAKAEGERAVAASGCRHLVVRTGWLFGGGAENPKNFVWRRIEEARHAATLTSDAGQRGCPTAVDDVARQTLRLVDAGLEGICNVVSQGAASRFDYVSAIVRAAGLPCRVVPGPSFKRLAAVSPNETALNARLGSLGLDRMPHWRDALDPYVATLLRSKEAVSP